MARRRSPPRREGDARAGPRQREAWLHGVEITISGNRANHRAVAPTELLCHQFPFYGSGAPSSRRARPALLRQPGEGRAGGRARQGTARQDARRRRSRGEASDGAGARSSVVERHVVGAPFDAHRVTVRPLEDDLGSGTARRPKFRDGLEPFEWLTQPSAHCRHDLRLPEAAAQEMAEHAGADGASAE